MKVVIVPGARNEERIAEIAKIRSDSTEEEWMDYVIGNASRRNSEWFDALYYSDEANNREALQEQARYFDDMLLQDESLYFAERLTKLESL